MTERPGTRSNEQTSARRVRRLSGAIVLLLLALTALPWGGAVAHAHASLVASDPADGALLVTAPETLRLTFNEDVTLLETTRLGGPGGETPYTAEVDGGLVTLRPGRALEDGRWDLVWQIVSADGHLVGGVLTFTVGTSTEVNKVLEDAPDATTYTDGAVVNPAGTGAPGVLDRILELLGWLALIAALGAILAAKHTPAAWLSAGAVLLPTLRVVDSTDRWGTSAWIIGETRAALVAAIAGGLLLAAALSRGRARTIATVLAVLAWASQALLSGHPNVIEPKPLYSALSALHLAGALTWSAAVTAALLDPSRGRHASRVATIGITALLPGALLLVTAFLPPALEHGAGRWEGILGVKALLVLGALGFGWRNHRVCRCPRCRRHGCSCPLEPDTRRHLRRQARIEIGLITLVAVLSASLTTSVPARVLHTGSESTATRVDAEAGTETGAQTDSPVEEEDAADSAGGRRQTNATLLFENGETGELLLEIDADGATTIHLVLRDAMGSPFTAEQVEYELENPELGIAGIAGPLPISGTMHMGDTVLPGSGTWRMSVTATYDTFTTVTATTEIQVAENAP